VTGILVASFLVFIVWFCCCGSVLRRILNKSTKRQVSKTTHDAENSVSVKIEYEKFGNHCQVKTKNLVADRDMNLNKHVTSSSSIASHHQAAATDTNHHTNQAESNSQEKQNVAILKLTEETQTNEIPRISIATSPFKEFYESRKSSVQIQKLLNYLMEDKSTSVSPDAFHEPKLDSKKDSASAMTRSNEAYVDDFDEDEEFFRQERKNSKSAPIRNNPYQSSYSPELSGIEFPVLKTRSSTTSLNIVGKIRSEVFELKDLQKPFQIDEQANNRTQQQAKSMALVKHKKIRDQNNNYLMYDQVLDTFKRPAKRTVSYLNKSPSRASITCTPGLSTNRRNFIELNKIRVAELSHGNVGSKQTSKISGQTDANNAKKLKLTHVSLDYEQTWEI
jgi:hypothetical protein